MAARYIYLFIFYFVHVMLPVFGNQIPMSNFVHGNLNDTILLNPEHILSQTNATDYIQCAFKCHMNDTCLSFYYTAELQQCQLQNIDLEISGSQFHLRSQPGSEYFYKAVNREDSNRVMQLPPVNIYPDAPTTESVLMTTAAQESKSNAYPANTSSTVQDTKAPISPTTTVKPTDPTTSTPTSTTTRTPTSTSTNKTPSTTTSTTPITTTRTTTRTTSRTTTATPSPCRVNSTSWSPVHYQHNSVVRYKVFTDTARSQPLASDKCREEGGVLLRLTSLSQLATFTHKVLMSCKELADGKFWVDGTNLRSQNNMYETITSLVIPVDMWDSNKPESPAINHCIKLEEKYNYKLDDTSCYKDGVYTFCQKI